MTRDEIVKCFESRKSQYTHVVLRGVCFADEKLNKLLPVIWVYDCLSDKFDKVPPDHKISYNKIIFIRKSFNLIEFANFLNHAGDLFSLEILSENIEIPVGYFKSINERLYQKEIFEKMGSYSPLTDKETKLLKESRSYPKTSSIFWPSLIPWPTKFFLFKMKASGDTESQLNMIKEQPFPLIENTPVFPSFKSAIQFWIGKESDFLSEWTIKISMPDYRARIENVKITKDNFQITIKPGISDPRNLTAKYYLDYNFAEPQNGELTLSEKGIGEVSSTGFPKELYLVLLDKKAPQEQLDYRHWASHKQDDIYDIEFLFEEQNVEFLISRGESYELEFKFEISEAKDSQEFLETVSAFSNYLGGKILVGVDDRGNIKGIDNGERTLQKINSLIEEWIEPRPPFNAICITHQEKLIAIVTIYGGDDKPYNYRKHGVYIRAGSTDRRAFRSELDSFYAQKKK